MCKVMQQEVPGLALLCPLPRLCTTAPGASCDCSLQLGRSAPAAICTRQGVPGWRAGPHAPQAGVGNQLCLSLYLFLFFFLFSLVTLFSFLSFSLGMCISAGSSVQGLW